MTFITPLLALLTAAMARKQTMTGRISTKNPKRTNFTCTYMYNKRTKTNQKHHNRGSPWPWMSPFALCPPLSVAQVRLSLFPRAAAMAKILFSDCSGSKNKVR